MGDGGGVEYGDSFPGDEYILKIDCAHTCTTD